LAIVEGEAKWLYRDHMPATPVIQIPFSPESGALRDPEPDHSNPLNRKPAQRSNVRPAFVEDPLLTVEDVAKRLSVSKDWVWDHSSRKSPRLPVIRMGDGTLRYRASGIEAFISERERISALRFGRR
jgi:predicted DNA-binding transcriptional regulator AlpA